MSEKEKKIFAGTNEGKIFYALQPNRENRLDQIVEETGVIGIHVGRIINKLIKEEVIEAERNNGHISVGAIHPEKSRAILERTKLYQIYSTIDKNPGVILSEICRKIKLDDITVKRGTTYLKNSNLIKDFKGKIKSIHHFTAEYPEKDALRRISK